MAFDEEQLNFIIKGLKEGGIDKKVVKELEKQAKLLKASNALLRTEVDTLKKQISTYIEIKINLEEQVSVKEQKIENLSKNIEDYILIENNLNEIIDGYKQKIKRKNGWIIKLVGTNVVTVGIILLIIL